MTDYWINNPSWTFCKSFLYVWYNRSIDLFKYIINVTLINNCSWFWVRIKYGIFCCIITFYIFKLYQQLRQEFKFTSLFLTADSISLSSGLKKTQNIKNIRFCLQDPFAIFALFCPNYIRVLSFHYLNGSEDFYQVQLLEKPFYLPYNLG